MKAWDIEKNGNGDVMVQRGTGRRNEGRTMFSFDRVFNDNAPTAQVYDCIAKPIVQAVLTGKHGTIFAYGQTGRYVKLQYS